MFVSVSLKSGSDTEICGGNPYSFIHLYECCPHLYSYIFVPQSGLVGLIHGFKTCFSLFLHN